MLSNVKESIAFYNSIFGFETCIVVPNSEEPVFAAIEKGVAIDNRAFNNRARIVIVSSLSLLYISERLK